MECTYNRKRTDDTLTFQDKINKGEVLCSGLPERIEADGGGPLILKYYVAPPSEQADPESILSYILKNLNLLKIFYFERFL